MSGADTYRFQCEFFDENSQMTREYLLSVFFSRTGGPVEVSIWDVKGHRQFLKRGVYDQDQPIRLQDLYVNGMVCICARKYKIVAYADTATREQLSPASGLVHTTIGGSAFSHLGVLMGAASENGFTFKRVKTMISEQHGAPPTVHMELLGEDAVNRWAQVVASVCGDSSGVTCGPLSQEADQIFSGKLSTATHDNCSLCIIRPHAVREGVAGTVISEILQAGLDISAMQTFSLSRQQTENFCEVYKTVLPSAQYSGMVAELSSGLCLVIEVRANDGAVQRLRDLCGPYDVEIARHLRPDTIRARLGRDNVHNVVHCTDLPEDGSLESQYFFSILPGAGA